MRQRAKVEKLDPSGSQREMVAEEMVDDRFGLYKALSSLAQNTLLASLVAIVH
jgi:hypothetical protein